MERFYEAERDYMHSAQSGEASFDAVQATLDPEVVLHQSPDLPWGGEFRGHAGYHDWAQQMSRAFDRLEVKDSRFHTTGDTVVVTCRLVTRSRASGEMLDLPMTQVVRVRDERIVEFRPFYWNVPAYCNTVRSAE